MAFDLQPAMRRRGTPELGYGDPPVPSSPSPSGPTTGYRDPAVPHVPELPRGPEAGGNPGIGGGVDNRTPVQGRGWDENAFRSGWMQHGGGVAGLQRYVNEGGWGNHVSLGGSKGDKVRLPDGRVIDAVQAAGAGGMTPQWLVEGQGGQAQGGGFGNIGFLLQLLASRLQQPQSQSMGAAPTPQVYQPPAFDINAIIQQAMGRSF